MSMNHLPQHHFYSHVVFYYTGAAGDMSIVWHQSCLQASGVRTINDALVNLHMHTRLFLWVPCLPLQPPLLITPSLLIIFLAKLNFLGPLNMCCSLCALVHASLTALNILPPPAILCLDNLHSPFRSQLDITSSDEWSSPQTGSAGHLMLATATHSSFSYSRKQVCWNILLTCLSCNVH